MNIVAIADARTLTRDEWLNVRRQGIGGSDAAAILGLNPYYSPLQVYNDKLGLSGETVENEAMRQGRDLEDYVAARFTEESGLRVRRVSSVLRHPVYPWMLANIDRRIVGANAGLECKTTQKYLDASVEGGQLPPNYYVQCMHYMAVTGASAWYIAILEFGRKFLWFRVERDEDEINALIGHEQAFWHDHVLAERPPYPTGSSGDDEALLEQYPEATADMPLSLYDVEDDVKRYVEIKRRIKQQEIACNLSAQRIKQILGVHDEGFTDDYRVFWKNTKAGRRFEIKEVR